MTQNTNTSMNVHLTGEGQTRGEVRLNEHQYSHGPYAVVELTLGTFSLTVFPGKNVSELAAALTSMGAELAELAEKVGDTRKALVLND